MKPETKKILIYTFIFDALLIVYLGGAYFFSSEVIDFKQRTMEEDRINQEVENWASFGLPEPEEHSFTNGDITLKAWYFPNSFKRDCGVLLLHGFTGTRWGVMKYAPIFWKRGCSIFAYDHRKHGESDGRYGTFGYYEKYDLLNGLKYFESMSGIAPERIGVLGESLGAATSILALEGNDKYAFLIAESPYKDLDSIVGKKAVEIYGSWVKLFIPVAYMISEIRADFTIDAVSPITAAKAIKLPTLIIHSNMDDYTPHEHSIEIHKNMNSETSELVLTDWGSKHARSINDDFEKFEAIVLEFLSRHAKDF
ncbi:MAG: alpha/beta hydrolase [Leptospira sp.]|nr:alpha/beta hydrolase [Leptospira sp.]